MALRLLALLAAALLASVAAPRGPEPAPRGVGRLQEPRTPQDPAGRATPTGSHWPKEAVDGRQVDWPGMQDKAHLVAFFSPRMDGLLTCLRCYQQLHEERGRGNLEVVGVCIDKVSRTELRALLAEHGLTFPVVIDAEGVMRRAFRPQAIPQVWFFAEERRFLGTLPGFPESGAPTPAVFYTNLLRRGAGLDMQFDLDPSTTPWPALPAFATVDGAASSAALHGVPYLLAFVASDCEKCRAQLQFFRTLHGEFAGAGLGFCVVLVDEQVTPEQFRQQRELPFAVHGDPGGRLRQQLGYRGFVPDTLVVDAAGRVRYRHLVFDDEQPALYRMELRQLLGLENPPILRRSGPSGVRRCMVCHEREYLDWRGSGHARALRSLQAIGKAEDADCVRCHVVGFGGEHGYDGDRGARAHLLGDVQCESCHGDGGPHLGQGDRRVTAATCAACHDEKHSLGFEYDRFVGLVSHASDLRGASAEQLAALAARRTAARRELLEPDGAYVGAARCLECHPAQGERWRTSPHSRALERLGAAERQRQECVRCHVTGSMRRWLGEAQPVVGDARSAGVQCESCHGPGERHVQARDAVGYRDSIIGLGSRCEECVVRQICTNCHDRENDPEFAFGAALLQMRARCRPAADK